MINKDPNNNKNYFLKMAGESTRSITEDYIKYRLESQIHYRWENGQQVPLTPTDVQRAMRHLGDEFEERYRSHLENMVQELPITHSNAEETFKAIIHEIFDDGVRWGRIVALYGFAARFSVLCVQKDMADMIDYIVEWVTTYMENDLGQWMTSNNKWQGFLKFYEDRSGRREENNWPNIRTFGGFAALAGIGVITLGAILTQRT